MSVTREVVRGLVDAVQSVPLGPRLLARLSSWGGQIRQRDLLPGMQLIPCSRLRRRPCKWTFVPMVSWDGKVRACACRFRGTEQSDGDELLVGDMKQESLSDIWLGPRPRELRRRFTRGDIPQVCADCAAYFPC